MTIRTYAITRRRRADTSNTISTNADKRYYYAGSRHAITEILPSAAELRAPAPAGRSGKGATGFRPRPGAPSGSARHATFRKRESGGGFQMKRRADAGWDGI